LFLPIPGRRALDFFYNATMADRDTRGLPTWLVLLTALVVPVVIGVAFLAALGAANRPVSVEEYRSNPNVGQEQSAQNSAIVLVHALAQLAFVVVGAWRITPRPEVRVVFLFVAIPVSFLVFALTFFGSMAK
jgi:amino acid transporter